MLLMPPRLSVALILLLIAAFAQIALLVLLTRRFRMDTVSLSGAPGSPYSRKMLAVLRYRRIPYRLFWPGREPADYPSPKVRLLPTFYLPGEDGVLAAVTDSTPLIHRFERDYSARPLRPASPALAFLDSLLEDYGDEWLTKAMFHYLPLVLQGRHRPGRRRPAVVARNPGR